MGNILVVNKNKADDFASKISVDGREIAGNSQIDQSINRTHCQFSKRCSWNRRWKETSARSSPQQAGKNELGCLHELQLNAICRDATQTSPRRLLDARRWPGSPPCQGVNDPPHTDCITGQVAVHSRGLCQSAEGQHDIRMDPCTQERGGRELRSDCTERK